MGMFGKKKKGKKSEGENNQSKPTVESGSGGVEAEEPSASNSRPAQDDAFSTGNNMQTIRTESTWEQMLYNTANWTYLPMSHGMEMELIICDDQGNYLTGDDMVYRMGEITRAAKTILEDIINGKNDNFPKMPEYIYNKIAGMPYTDEDVEKGLVVKLPYKLEEQTITVDSFGRDGNVTAITYILELVSPPCQYAEELAYWASTLFNLAKEVLPRDLHIVASGINPASTEYNRGLSQGDHHHIGGFRTVQERVQCYDMIRNFIPHIIALSVNSPIIKNAPTDVIKVRNGIYTCPNCIRSLRLANNKTMLSSNESKRFLPYLATGTEEEQSAFLNTLQKASMEDARFQDVFPFTDWGTMEVRVMDAQLSICRRIGLGLLIQAMCYKVQKMQGTGEWVPDVGSDTLTGNRKGSYERGLIAPFKNFGADRAQLDSYQPGFSEYYFGPENRPYRYLFQSVQGMFHYLKEELKELKFLYSPFLKPILQSVFGDITYAKPPLTEAEYLLSLYHHKQQNGEVPNVLADLIYFTIEYSRDPLQQPLTGELTLPKTMTD